MSSAQYAAALSARPARSARRECGEFSIAQAYALVRDLFRPNPLVYWADLVGTVAVGYTFAALFFRQPAFSWQQAATLLVSGFALFRAGTFIHEIQHFPAGTMTAFKVIWNLVCGIPLLMPSFFYGNHAGHHRRTTYGTLADGEYLPLGSGPWRHFAVYVAQAFLLPGMVAIRFLILAPVSFFSPALRQVILERFSYFGINPHYRRELHPSGAPAWWTAIEAACCARIWFSVGLVVAGACPPYRLAQLYTLGIVSLGLNYVRNLAAHRYRNTAGPMTHNDQLLDSINITGRPLVTELFFPLGLRYHALHHLFPTLPGHNLGKAHRRLMAALPSDSPYRQTVHPTYLHVVRQLLQDARRGRREQAGLRAARA